MREKTTLIPSRGKCSRFIRSHRFTWTSRCPRDSAITSVHSFEILSNFTFIHSSAHYTSAPAHCCQSLAFILICCSFITCSWFFIAWWAFIVIFTASLTLILNWGLVRNIPYRCKLAPLTFPYVRPILLMFDLFNIEFTLVALIRLILLHCLLNFLLYASQLLIKLVILISLLSLLLVKKSYHFADVIAVGAYKHLVITFIHLHQRVKI